MIAPIASPSDDVAGRPLKSAPDYSVPALDKALDILELLADRGDGLSQLEIAQAIERSPSQIFRVLTTLERRGFVFRDRSGLYVLSLRLFDLAHRHEPLRSLTAAALPVMRELAGDIQQSCNLSVLDAERVRVIAQVESPGDFGFSVRVGALFSVTETATGMVLEAFRPEVPADGGSALERLLAERIRGDGYLERPDARQPSITDVVFPILRADSTAVAALTVPYVATSLSAEAPEVVIGRARDAAAEIGRSLALAPGAEARDPRLEP
ncbi:IclR family transcriptional regulator [Herbiconiux daphne]|uniref:Helix-turn-helix domain-containing protein n=1 Tax=Herbiconiux daphne TaxID=2970914 RepID=A0ABT2H4G8_9MICO|nr:helix-turn-helix domain-containing protein [Herbiconiux daphne]MCS5734837.1 helix-turn-helix domain-containing protein [Herbiconiux daphne]